MVLLEVCVDSRESLANAVRGGAQRLEVCARLDLGGLTPTDDVLRAALASGLPCVAMVRPRGGDFVYTPAEVELMRADVARMKRFGAHALVFGALTSRREIDSATAAELIALARPLPVVFHRAFDEIVDQFTALETLVNLGVARILTSGGERDAHTGRFRLRELVERARERIAILPGGGVRAHNAAEILRVTGASELHSSTPFDVRDLHSM